MGASVRRTAKKKKIVGEEPVSRDTWPVPPPESAAIPVQDGPVQDGGDSEGAHDTIPTPAPDSGDDAVAIEIPTLRGIDVSHE
jgi:hypothetical protein